MPLVNWSPAARLDLDRIGNWLDEYRGLAFSADMLAAIQHRSEFLVRFPHGGRPLGGDMRMLRVLGTRYLIIYRLHSDGPEVIRVHHEREDWLVEQ